MAWHLLSIAPDAGCGTFTGSEVRFYIGFFGPMTQSVMIGASSATRNVLDEADCAARCDAKVLITGESGVGKEIVARVIHQRSARSMRSWSASTAPAFLIPCSNPSCSDTSGAASRAPIATSAAGSKRQTAEQFSWTKSAK